MNLVAPINPSGRLTLSRVKHLYQLCVNSRETAAGIRYEDSYRVYPGVFSKWRLVPDLELSESIAFLA